ncbi:MAG: Rrf2 family transcriptional regulator [Verrucomicrobia bacterium]|nr:MAG: Rrf2 family transcriptional regulator [Verrucomicrobiota bacterium]
MKLSVKSDYAARAILALARSQPGIPRKVEELAAEQNIPANYLVQILIELKTRGLVASQRGKVGGYTLAKPPSQITLADVLEAIHGHVFDTPAIDDPNCPGELRDAWRRLREKVVEAAREIDFQTLVEEGQRRAGMYYI